MQISLRRLILASWFMLAYPAYGQAQAAKEDVADTVATERPVAAASEAAVVTTAGENGFQLQASDTSFVLRVRGDAMMDGRFLIDDAQQVVPNTFYLRRARPALQGTVFSQFDFFVRADFGQGTTQLLDAYLSARLLPGVNLQFGKFKAPVGLERLQSATDLSFNELALPTELVPNRDVGVMLYGSVLAGRLDYALALVNGAPDGRSLDADAADGKEIDARLFGAPFAGSSGLLKGLGFGLGASLGTEEGSVAAPALPAFRSSSRQTFFRYRQGTDAATTVVAEGRHLRLAPQAYFYAGTVGLLGEFVRDAQAVQLGEAAATLVHRAWQVTAAFVLTGDRPTYRRLRPWQPFDPARGQWGAFELVARLHALDVDEAAFPLYANAARSAQHVDAWAAGVNWYLNANVRLMLSYEQARYEAAAGGAALDTEHLVLSRFQFVF